MTNNRLPRAADHPARSPGRPSVTTERRSQITDAFIELIAERGLEHVTVDDVAARAGVARSAVRHFVGNRADLITLAIESLVGRYEAAIRAEVGPQPGARELVALLFSRAWIERPSDADRAFAALEHEAIRDEGTRRAIRAAYGALVDELVAAMRRSGATAPRAPLAEAAYLIVCLAEQNATLQAVGFPHSCSRVAEHHAGAILDGLLSASGSLPAGRT